MVEYSVMGGELTEGYRHKVQYYETDKMGITHHSNYIRWMEEARVDFLARIGWDYAKLEELGIASPVMSVECKYRRPTTFDDEVYISLSVAELRPARMTIAYEMRGADGELVCTAESGHCFLTKDGGIVRLDREYPAFYAALAEYIKKDDKK